MGNTASTRAKEAVTDGDHDGEIVATSVKFRSDDETIRWCRGMDLLDVKLILGELTDWECGWPCEKLDPNPSYESRSESLAGSRGIHDGHNNELTTVRAERSQPRRPDR